VAEDLFTGLIEEIGIVRAITGGAVGRLRVTSGAIASAAAVGDSVAVDGVCLTVTAIDGGELSFDAVPETLSRSTLKDVRVSDRANLESSLRAGGKIGGHFVLGHVDGVGRIESVRKLTDSAEIRIAAPREVMRYVVEKGSVAVNGISLTIASCDSAGFTVAVIPHTLSVTTLGEKKPGDRVNLETDILGKYVEKFATGGTGVTEELLRNAGFM
jgi:riboflavin synthase